MNCITSLGVPLGEPSALELRLTASLREAFNRFMLEHAATEKPDGTAEATIDNPLAFDFGNVHVGDSLSQAVSITNSAVADAFSRITGGERIGVCTVMGGINPAGLQIAFGALGIIV